MGSDREGRGEGQGGSKQTPTHSLTTHQHTHTQYARKTGWGPRPARPAAVVSEDLRAAALALYDAHSDSGGRGGVDYAAARADARLWSRYADAAAELQRADLSALSSKEELSAFAINAYNALIVHALVAHGGSRLASAATRGSFFKEGAKYLVGGLEYSADDLEHGVLRGNRPPPSSLPALLLGLVGLRARAPGPFADGDPRGRAVVAGPIDARLHFALVCGARACPPIRVYRASNLDEGLRAAAEAFCAGDVEVRAVFVCLRVCRAKGWMCVCMGGGCWAQALRGATMVVWLLETLNTTHAIRPQTTHRQKTTKTTTGRRRAAPRHAVQDLPVVRPRLWGHQGVAAPVPPALPAP